MVSPSGRILSTTLSNPPAAAVSMNPLYSTGNPASNAAGERQAALPFVAQCGRSCSDFAWPLQYIIMVDGSRDLPLLERLNHSQLTTPSFSPGPVRF